MMLLIVLALVCLLIVTILLVWATYRLAPVLSGTKHAALIFAPHELRANEIVFVLIMLVMKSAYSQIWGLQSRAHTTQPASELSISAPFRIEKKDLARYQQTVGGETTIPNSLITGHSLALFLSALTEPAMLLLLASPACSISPLGAVNVRNRFELLRPDLCALENFSGQNAAAVVARLRNERRIVKRGIEHDLEVCVLVPQSRSNLVPVFRQIFTMLELVKTVSVQRGEQDARNLKRTTTSPSAASPIAISFTENEPWRWAALCKDYNLIHLSGFAAEAFGLPGKLAHGNHVVAKALQKLLDKAKLRSQSDIPIWLEVHFKRPIVVPCSLQINVRPAWHILSGFTVNSKRGESVIVEYGPL
ncbi:hypothetical protein BKA63DRAFT_526089 [Paraphoma chrysanthemicola]|nr:hypothetical protein BKA63DRAFT_526089 [Paraphoma chrysanthemicola]